MCILGIWEALNSGPILNKVVLTFDELLKEEFVKVIPVLSLSGNP